MNQEEIAKDWEDFKNMNIHLLYLSELLFPNDIFMLINGLPINSGTHKGTAFCFYALVNAFHQLEMTLSFSAMKVAWGYNKTTQSIDYISKENGVLDSYGLTETLVVGLTKEYQPLFNHNSNVMYTKLLANDVDITNGNFFRVPCEIMLRCMFKCNELGTVGFYIYCLICLYSQFNRGEFKDLSRTAFIDRLGISKGTIKKYLDALVDDGLIIRIEGKKISRTMNEMNKYKPIREFISHVIPQPSGKHTKMVTI